MPGKGLLSTRGLVLLAGGLSATVAAAVLGEGDLVFLGLFTLLLPLTSLAWTTGRGLLGPPPLEVTRHLAATRAVVGQPLQVTVDVRHPGRGRTGGALLEDLVPPGLALEGGRPRSAVAGLAPGAHHRFQYVVVPVRRGVLELGPLRLRPTSPLGLVERRSTAGGTSRVLVTPRTTPLPLVAHLRQARGVGDHRPRRHGSGSAEDASIRAYRRGDDLRLVHWRSSARRGALQVRQGEDLRTPRTLLALDDLGDHSRGRGGYDPADLERAVEVAASVGQHLLGIGQQVDLATLGAGPASLARVLGPDHLLDRLAAVERVTDTPRSSLAATPTRPGDVLVVVLAGCEDPQVVRKLPVVPRTAPALVLVAGRQHLSPALEEALVGAAWTTVAVPDLAALPGAWATAGERTSRAGAGTS